LPVPKNAGEKMLKCKISISFFIIYLEKEALYAYPYISFLGRY
jgi:hypothetical protein